MDVTVELPVRADQSEDVIVWMKKLEVTLGLDHFKRSPGCEPKTLQNIKIPDKGRAWIGGPLAH